jgi:G:T-mismatch repair DNA endonuclease (very short patch repair protein)
MVFPPPQKDHLHPRLLLAPAHLQIRPRHPQDQRRLLGKKRQANKARDRKNLRTLKSLGWDVLVIWQCQTRDSNRLTARLQAFLSRPSSPRNEVRGLFK